MKTFLCAPLWIATLALLSNTGSAEPDEPGGERGQTLGTVTVVGSRPTSLPTQIPTTIEGVTGDDIQRKINATDSEDALKYFPSLLVRKRYIGDFDHAVLGTRASGTNNSARSLVYADGILISNLLGNSQTFTPRWGMVTPEEIERVDVLYGPFSAAYPGNSVGAVVDYVTRMPTKFEAHLKAASFGEDFKIYSTNDRYSGWQGSASVGDRQGAWSWWVGYNRLDSDGHPLTFANKLLSAGVAGNGGVPVTGAISDRNPKNQDWLILGAGTIIDTTQDHAKAKLAYDFSPTLRASYTLGWWRNDAQRSVDSYLRDAAGQPVYSGAINVDGRQYSLTPADFSPSNNSLEHFMHGLSLKSHTQGAWDWEVAASLYDFSKDISRTPTVALPAASSGGVGRITDQDGTGWNTLALKATWRPQQSAEGSAGNHVIDFGYQRDAYKLRTLVSDTGNWINGAAGARFSEFRGETRLQGLYLQDTWAFATDWKATLGLRLENWQAFDGGLANAATPAGRLQAFAERNEDYVSPKFAIAYQLAPLWVLKASVGRAVRVPTVTELYQGTISSDVIVNNDPNLQPEKSWTGELTAQRELENGLLRATYFHEDTRDALYSQTNGTVTPAVTNIQNVDHIRTSGMELAYQASDVFLTGLALSGSVTYARSRIVENDNFQASVGKWQPRVPEWRANLLATYELGEKWMWTVGARYSGRQYNTLDNSDPNGFTYTGTSSFFVANVRVRYLISDKISASIGVDNLNNEEYWAFHPYTQRTATAELSMDF